MRTSLTEPDLLYLALRAAPAESLRVLPVGLGVVDRREGRERVGTVVLLEEDPSTEEARREVRPGRRRRGEGRLDMLTAQVPGTDLVVGLSRRLYAACSDLAEQEAEFVAEVDAQRPPPRPAAEDAEVEEITRERWHRLQVIETENRSVAAQVA